MDRPSTPRPPSGKPRESMGGRVRLADLLAGLSVAADLGMGLRPEESMRSCVIGTGLARRLGLDEREVGHVLYTTLLFHLGCTAYAHERAGAFGDEIALNATSARTNFLDPRDLFKTMLPGIAQGLGPAQRARVTTYMVVRGNRFGRRAMIATCEVGRRMARRLGLPDPVQQALYEVFEYWNGKGTPRGLKDEESALCARIARVAAIAALFCSRRTSPTPLCAGRWATESMRAPRTSRSMPPTSRHPATGWRQRSTGCCARLMTRDSSASTWSGTRAAARSRPRSSHAIPIGFSASPCSSPRGSATRA